jgi:hypothetical protein
MVFQCIAPDTFEVSTPALDCACSQNLKLHTLRYRKVMRDQRCLCPELDPLVSSSPVDVWVCSPRLVRTKEQVSVRSLLRDSTSTYLLSKCQRWIYIRTRLVILSINISLVRTPIVYHCSEACNCENTSKIECDNLCSTNHIYSCLDEDNWLMATHLDRLKLWSCWKDWCQWVANLIDVWDDRI